MVFGIGEGRMDIVLDKINYSLGDTVKGTIKLELKSPKKARALRLDLWGEREGAYKKVGKNTTRQKEIVHKFTLNLDGEKEYKGQEYPFEIALPKTPEPQKLEGAAATVVGVAQSLGLTPSPISRSERETPRSSEVG
jgi:hypothetical protein